eukprot:scaffold1638_cov103-Amphora_coffeaeformis.AAC.1
MSGVSTRSTAMIILMLSHGGSVPHPGRQHQPKLAKEENGIQYLSTGSGRSINKHKTRGGQGINLDLQLQPLRSSLETRLAAEISDSFLSSLGLHLQGPACPRQFLRGQEGRGLQIQFGCNKQGT